MTSENECREAFESFMSNRRMSLDKGEDGYEDGFTDWNWTVWQAAWNARSKDAEDARRYQYAKANNWPRTCPAGYFLSDGVIYPSVDQAIDAAMSK